jgi:hypothetical protein
MISTGSISRRDGPGLLGRSRRCGSCNACSPQHCTADSGVRGARTCPDSELSSTLKPRPDGRLDKGGNCDRKLSRHSHGLGRRRRAGVSGSTGVRLLAPVEGTELTTSGWWRLFSARSIAADKAVRDPLLTMATEKTRFASLPHTKHVTESGAIPIGRIISHPPC